MGGYSVREGDMAGNPMPIPKFVVDLSQSPETRYAHIVPEFRDAIRDSNLPGLLSELLDASGGRTLGSALQVAARLALRRVYDAEESAEIRGIARLSGISTHVLVAFNVFLDLLLGCTSGGVLTANSPSRGVESRVIMHFRTLEWAMDRLRRIVIEIDFVRRPKGPVVATSITYLGYVGVLTGVRKGLSMSLNFRPRHAAETWWQRFLFRQHQALVLLGFRRSISSEMRRFLLTPQHSDHSSTSENDCTDEVSEAYMLEILQYLSTSASTAAYLIFCQPGQVYVVEKDHRTAEIAQSDTFLVACNHDLSDETRPERLADAVANIEGEDLIGMSDIVAFSVDRKQYATEFWRKRLRLRQKRRHTRQKAVTLRDVHDLVQDEEINSDETHYAVIMSPTEGKVVWRMAYECEEI